MKRIQLDCSPQKAKGANETEQTRSIFTVGSSYICPGDYADSARWEDKREVIKLKHRRKRAVSPIEKLFFHEISESEYVPFEGKV